MTVRGQMHLTNEAVSDNTAVPLDARSNSEAKNEALEALTALGYSPSEALKALQQVAVTEDMDSGTVLKQALKSISTI